jgi:hypothetical protein
MSMLVNTVNVGSNCAHHHVKFKRVWLQVEPSQWHGSKEAQVRVSALAD